MRAGDDQPRVALAKIRQRSSKNVGASAKEEHAEAFGLRDLQKPEHEIDSRDALGQRLAEQPRCPDERLAVGAHELGVSENFSQAPVAPCVDGLGGGD